MRFIFIVLLANLALGINATTNPPLVTIEDYRQNLDIDKQALTIIWKQAMECCKVCTLILPRR